ncbi:MAG TPA: glycosyltransferase family 9 protein [Candidatus Sulfotelmatobacter sp.]|nr:glycosyltransferase family 9 protein [Candidatus Sulfotelmatobacter sp.]
MGSLPPQRVLIFRIGSLGDTLVGVPALRAVRARYPEARITLLCDRQVGKSWVLAADVLSGTGLVDDFLYYPFDPTSLGRRLQPLRMARLLLSIRARRFDAFVYLVPSNRGAEAIARDRRYFALAGLRASVGFEGFPDFPTRRPAGGFAPVLQEADLLLARLAVSGWQVPAPGAADMTLRADAPEPEAEAWLSSHPRTSGGPPIAVGIGGKKPVTVWPLERYDAVVRHLIRSRDVWPVVFGGPEDASGAERLVAGWGRGAVGAGALTPHQGIGVMRHLALYVGNDTGTMHMAVAAGLRCVAPFSSAHLPGWWFPYGTGHRVLRTAIECENCGLQVCVERGLACLLGIDAARVVAACEEVLSGAAPRSG